MSNPTTTTYCFRCQRHPASDEPPLQRCARCQSRHYCSKECQKYDWPTHKNECARLAEARQEGREATSARTRITTRINLESLRSPSQNNTSKIYYLKTSRPHINDVTISGPYYPIDTVAQQIRLRLVEEECEDAFIAFEEMYPAGQMSGFGYFNAPLANGHIMRFELLEEENAEVAAAMPCSAWRVVSVTPNLDDHGEFIRNPDRPAELTGFIPTKDAKCHKTFLDVASANIYARRLLEDMQKDMPNSRIVSIGTNPLFAGGICPASGRTRSPKVLVTVDVDDGQLRYPNPYSGSGLSS